MKEEVVFIISSLGPSSGMQNVSAECAGVAACSGLCNR